MVGKQPNLDSLFDLRAHYRNTGALRLYNRAIESTSCGILISDARQPNIQIIYCNRAFERITGYSTQEILGHNCRFLQGPNTDPHTVDEIRQALRAAEECQVVIQNYRKDGTPFWNELIISPVYSRRGSLTHFIGVQTDITDRIQAQLAQQKSEEKLRLSLKAACMSVWEWDTRENHFTWSEEAESLLGFTPGSCCSTLEDYLSCVHPEDYERVKQELTEFFKVAKEFNLEHRFLRTDGKVGWVAMKGSGLQDQMGYLRIMGTLMDITERKQTEEALRQQFLREQLISTIAQRIRQSLNPEEVLNTAVEEVRQFLQTDRVVLYRFEPDWSGVVVVESVGEGFIPINGMAIEDRCFVETHLSRYQQGRVRAIDDIYTVGLEHEQCHVDLLSQYQVRANLVVPILQNNPHSEFSTQNHLWGLLIAHHCSSVRVWQESDVELLKQLSVQLAIAIQQATLFHQLETELAERKQAEATLRESEAKFKEQAAQLKATLQELQQTQTKLIQVEKMSSLGQLVAGVAHEINNPVSFIYGNLSPALQYTQNLLDMLSLYQKYLPQPPTEIQSQAEEIDLEFITEDLPKLLASMKVGADRIRDLVVSLRNFSRVDETRKKPVDIHQGIDNTLLILQHRLKAEGNNPAIEIVKEYGNLPKVECYAGQLNQVFMNLLSNAIDALTEQETGKGESLEKPSIFQTSKLLNPTIWIRTEQPDPNRVLIRIADNGSGIPEAIQQRIFDPFFTTKPVGKGTGLGLSISYQVVVDRHGGQLCCLSTPGQGTEFVVEIPLNKPSQPILDFGL